MGNPGTARRPVLDPSTRFGEVLFGLIMVLSFTGSLEVATAGRADVRTMLIGALGCNLAWGIVDAVMYLVNEHAARNRTLLGIRTLRAAGTSAEADRALDLLLPAEIAAFLTPEERSGIRGRLLALPAPPDRAFVDGPALRGAGAVFLLVFLSTFPAAAPFLLVPDPALAVRVSNLVALVMMFAAGMAFGRHAGLPPVRSGLWAAGTGAALVGVTLLLGG